jgi:hypothetical protein
VSRRVSRISHALRGDPFGDPEPLIRRVYAFVAYRIGPGAPAEKATRDVFTRVLASETAERDTDVWLIDTARRELDERFGPSERDRGFVALHLVGLDAPQIAELLRFRREAAAVALARALSRVPEDEEPAWAEPSPRFVERLVNDIRAARQPSSGRRRRALAAAVAALALLAAVPAFGALVAGDNADEEAKAVPRSSAPTPRERPREAWRPRRGAQRQPAKPRTASSTARRTKPQAPRPFTTSPDATVQRAAPPPPERGAACDRLAERLDALLAGHEHAQARLVRRHARERQNFFRRVSRRAALDLGSRRLAVEFLRQRSALEARHYREGEALLERQNRELRKLEAQRKRCDG